MPIPALVNILRTFKTAVLIAIQVEFAIKIFSGKLIFAISVLEALVTLCKLNKQDLYLLRHSEAYDLKAKHENMMLNFL